jgi:hypothetical protein
MNGSRSFVAALLVATLLPGLAPAAHSQAADSTRRAAPRDTARAAARDSSARATQAPRQPITAPVSDSLPSADARAVLRTIPEPLTPEEQVDAPDSTAIPEPVLPDTAAADTVGVPTPSPTVPLGERPGGARDGAALDSLMAAPGSPPGAAVLPAPPAPARNVVAPDTCWRLQIAAPTDLAEAQSRKAAAESQLLLPMTIETEHDRHKVRTRDCQSLAVAQAVRARAQASGFTGAFLIRTVGGATEPAEALHPSPPAKKSAPARPAARPRATSKSRR